MATTDDKEIDLWKTKQLLKFLKEASGNGTSVISIVMAPGESIAKMNQKLTDEYGTANNVKARVNRLSIQSAIVSAQQRLKLYHKIPPNGLCIYSGEVVGTDQKAKKVVIDFEPFKPINTKLYLCDNRFHVEALEELLVDEKLYAFVIVDGNGCMLATLSGNTRSVLDRFEGNLLSKTRRGGQSSNRFARLREEVKQGFVKKVCEKLNSTFIKAEKVRYQGIIIAGNADVKHDVYDCAILDPRVRAKVIEPLLDVSYGFA
jgi:peptide chain release factor subunit 1